MTTAAPPRQCTAATVGACGRAAPPGAAALLRLVILLDEIARTETERSGDGASPSRPT